MKTVGRRYSQRNSNMSKHETMSKSKKSKQDNSSAPPYGETHLADGGELHQVAGGEHPALTTNQGVMLSDNQNSLRANPRGPTLLEDFILREKIFHFDHERIPERTVTIVAPKWAARNWLMAPCWQLT